MNLKQYFTLKKKSFKYMHILINLKILFKKKKKKTLKSFHEFNQQKKVGTFMKIWSTSHIQIHTSIICPTILDWFLTIYAVALDFENSKKIIFYLFHVVFDLPDEDWCLTIQSNSKFLIFL